MGSFKIEINGVINEWSFPGIDVNEKIHQFFELLEDLIQQRIHDLMNPFKIKIALTIDNYLEEILKEVNRIKQIVERSRFVSGNDIQTYINNAKTKSADINWHIFIAVEYLLDEIHSPVFVNFNYEALPKVFFYEDIDNYFKYCPELKETIDLIAYLDYFIYLNEEYSKIKDIGTKNQQVKTGYKSSLSDAKINILFNKLVGNYIKNDTPFENFRAVFFEKPLPKEFKPIIKEKKFTKTLLAYFISELFQKDNQGDYWKIGEYCFNTKSLAQSYSNSFSTNKHNKPRGFEEIDKILRDI